MRARNTTVRGSRLRRLVLVVVLVLVVTAAYRLPESPEQTGTGTLSVSQPWPTPGEEVPSFEATRLNGERFVMPGEGTYVISFWSSLNQGSQSARPEFEQLAREYEGSEASFAAIYVGGVLEEDRNGSPYAVIQDDAGELTSMYNVKRVPRIFLIEDGSIQLVENNLSEETERSIRQELDSALRDSD